MGKTPAAPSGYNTVVNAAIQGAQEKLRITVAAYTASQANYQKAVENQSKVERGLAMIKGNPKNLQLQQAQKDEIKKILRHCIGALIQMKAQITNLVSFFPALSAMIEHVVKHNAREFLNTVDTAQSCLIGNITLRHELPGTVHHHCNAPGVLLPFNTICSMYTKILILHIRPGIALCDQLSQSTSDPNAMQQRMKALDQFTDSAQDGVRQLVSVEQKTITKSVEDRVDLARKETSFFLPYRKP